MESALDTELASTKTGIDALQPLYASCIIFIVLNTFFFVSRFVSRLAIRRLEIGWDDITIIPAYISTLSISIIGLLIVHYETMEPSYAHVPILNSEQLVPTLKCIWTVPLLSLPAYTLTRISLLFLYLRIFTGRIVRSLCWSLMVFLMICWASYSVTSIFQCVPIDFFWNRLSEEGQCFNIDNFYRSFTPPYIVADILTILIPIPTVWRLRSSNSRKIGLTVLFCIGIIALAASCGRLYAYVHTSTAIIEPVWTNELMTWIVVEAGLYHIAACLPAMHHLSAMMLPARIRRRMEDKLGSIRRQVRARSPLDLVSRSRTPWTMTRAETPRDELEEDFKTWDIEFNSKGHAMAVAKRATGNPKLMELGNGRGNLPSSIPIDDLRRGGGILVENEITVTQEERIQSVIGF